MNGVRDRTPEDFRAKQLKYRCASKDPDAARIRLYGWGSIDRTRLTHGRVTELFSAYGRVWDVSIHGGFFFVQYDNEKAAYEAIKAFNGSSVFGGRLELKFAKQREEMNHLGLHVEPCKYFQVDNCYRGADCHFKHVKDPSFVYGDQFSNRFREGTGHGESNRKIFDERPPHLRTAPRKRSPIDSRRRTPPRGSSPRRTPPHRSIPTARAPERDARDRDQRNERDRDRRVRSPERRRSPLLKREGELLPDVPSSRRARVDSPILPRELLERRTAVPVIVQAPVAIASVAAATAAAKAAAGTPEVDLRPPFDCVIITYTEKFRSYCMMIEDKLIARRMLTNIQVVAGEHLFKKAVEEAARYTVPYAICISDNNVDHRSMTLNILHGTPQEHRNMPLEDALIFLERSFDRFVEKMKKKIAAVNDWTPPTKNMIGILTSVMQGTPVKYKQMNEAIDYLVILKEKARAIDSITDPSLEEPSPSVDSTSSREAQSDIYGLPPPKFKPGESEKTRRDPSLRRTTATGIDFEDPAVKRAISQLMATKAREGQNRWPN